MSDRNYSRRHFLLTVGMAGAVAPVLTGCPRDEPAEPRITDTPDPEARPPAEAPIGDVVAAECPGYDQLTESDLAVRRTLNYVDVTPNPGEYCHNCRFEAVGDFGDCTGCELFPGPVAPEGWCSSWIAEA